MTVLVIVSLMTVETAAQAAYIVAALLFILALAGLSRHETAKSGQHVRDRRDGGGAGGHDRARGRPRHLRGRARAAGGGDAGRGRDRAVAGAGGRDDRDARADRAAPLASWVWRRCWWAGTATCTSRATPTAPKRLLFAAQDLTGIHSAEVFIGVFIGAVTFTGSIVAFLKLSARIKSSPLMLPGKNVLNLGALVAFGVFTVWFVIDPRAVAADHRHRDRAGPGLAPGRLHRRRRHAGGGLDAEQLLRVGRRGVRVPARERPADHHRRPGRLLGCLPVLHHVQGDEPVLHLGHRRRLRDRGRPLGRDRLRRAPRDHRRRRRRAPRLAPTR